MIYSDPTSFINMGNTVESGILLVDKPAGTSSFGIVRSVRRLIDVKKVGHAGTLDPFATGLLIICIGRPATRMISRLMEGEKEYTATMRLGAISTTQDPEGEITPVAWEKEYSQEIIQETFMRFTGTILQTPPSFSALKYKGKPLYHYARRGIPVNKEARKISIHSLCWANKRTVVDNTDPYITFTVRSGKGAYIRALAADIGEALGCGSYLTALRRTRSGCFSVDNAIQGEVLRETNQSHLVLDRILSIETVENMLQ